MKKLLFLSKRWNASSTRLRFLPYFRFLEKEGYLPKYMVLSSHPFIFGNVLKEVRSAWGVILQRKLIPLPYLFLLRKCANILIFDFDDAIYMRPQGKSKTRESRFLKTLTLVDAIWAGSDYLAQKAKALTTKKVYILPTVPDLSRYPLPTQKESASPEERLRLVWIGSSSTRSYLEEILPLLGRLYPKTPFVLRNISDFLLKSREFPIENYLWSPENEVQGLIESHIGIAPLKDTPWTLGKCGFKILQYMAASLPVVASPVGVQTQFVIPNQTGFWVKTQDDWQKALQELSSSSKRAFMGKEGRNFLEKNYSLQKNLETMLHSLSSFSSMD